MRRFTFFLLLSLIPFAFHGYSQDLMNLFGDQKPGTDMTTATFKSTRLMVGQSVENPANGVLVFILSHRFGALNSGASEFFGMDQATMRLGLEYGVNDRLAVGAGRSQLQKTFDGFLKYKILRQSKGKVNRFVTMSYFGSIALMSDKWQNPENKNYFSSRLSFVHQLLIARKFTSALSLQLMPTYVHKNLADNLNYTNDTYAVGAGGRYKLTNRSSVNAEYYYLLPGKNADMYQNCIAMGFDVETGGHVFQLIFSNARAQFERGFIAETTGKFTKGDIYFGFNLTRVFTVKKTKSAAD